MGELSGLAVVHPGFEKVWNNLALGLVRIFNEPSFETVSGNEGILFCVAVVVPKFCQTNYSGPEHRLNYRSSSAADKFSLLGSRMRQQTTYNIGTLRIFGIGRGGVAPGSHDCGMMRDGNFTCICGWVHASRKSHVVTACGIWLSISFAQPLGT